MSDEMLFVFIFLFGLIIFMCVVYLVRAIYVNCCKKDKKKQQKSSKNEEDVGR